MFYAFRQYFSHITAAVIISHYMNGIAFELVVVRTSKKVMHPCYISFFLKAVNKNAKIINLSDIILRVLKCMYM